jgi:XRE family transcriptional regulator, aerobic/anaerobic benzoate catabolism transcriptional regulator
LIADQAEAEFLVELGRRLREHRKTLGMSRHDLARASHVSERYIALIEGGKGNISILLLRRLASVLCSPPIAGGRAEGLPSLLCDKLAAVEM